MITLLIEAQAFQSRRKRFTDNQPNDRNSQCKIIIQSIAFSRSPQVS
jgi:hypothetical protein